jgi:hypothetical protein
MKLMDNIGLGFLHYFRCDPFIQASISGVLVDVRVAVRAIHW